MVPEDDPRAVSMNEDFKRLDAFSIHRLKALSSPPVSAGGDRMSFIQPLATLTSAPNYLLSGSARLKPGIHKGMLDYSIA